MAKRARKLRGLVCVVAWAFSAVAAAASDYRGVVDLGGIPVPGATVTATQDGKKVTVITGQDGSYSLDLPDGKWTIAVQMTGFAPLTQDVVIAPNTPPGQWDLKMLPLGQIKAAAAPPPGQNTPVPQAPAARPKPQESAAANAPPPAPASDEMNQRAANGLLINGSVNNGADSPFAQSAAFGNNRFRHGLYNGNVGFTLDNSALDARSYSLTGQNTPKPSYNRFTGLASVGGPLRIPHLMPNGPTFLVNYQWTRNRTATTQSATVPTVAERGGNFSQAVDASGNPIQIFNPATGQPYSGDTLPAINPQAYALLQFYPLPNVNNGTRYNYQIPIVSPSHADALQSHVNKQLGANSLSGNFTFQSTRSGSPNLFNFLDTTDVLGIDGKIRWFRRVGPRLFMNPSYEFSRYRTRLTPYFENRENVSADAGIAGNDQDPTDWGPPALGFSSILGLSDGQSTFNRNQTNTVSDQMSWNHERHNVTFGGDFYRLEFNVLSQQNARGTFNFTGAATQGMVNGAPVGGSDIADFLLGIPDASQIAFGNADKYFRESRYDAYVNDDWRISPGFSANVGIRWEYGAPITELEGRLVNLDIAPGFTAAAPVVASDPVGPVTGRRYPSSLVQPDRNGFEPRIGIAWRPLPASSLVIRAGYGITDDTSVYQTIVNSMAQQAPLSKSLSVGNSAACPLTLANGFNPCSSTATTQTTFAIDPNFRIGYVQTWDVEVQRDLPGSLQLLATYLGNKGTHGMQEFLPNTYPIGAASPCPDCPVGFYYLTSGGNSTRQSGMVQLRRRLHNGLTATVEYTSSKSIDDDSALGGQGGSSAGGASSSGAAPANLTPAQDWLNLKGERGLSTFDQRHLATFQLTYTTGMGLKGGTLLSGWKGALYKEWTFFTQITAGSGLPETPSYPGVVPGTGFGGIRPSLTGASIHAAPPGYFLNPASFTAPAPGEWGDAGRDSIIGPNQFSLNASLGRTFRVKSRYSLDLRVDSTNTLNHVAYTSWNTTINSGQFGLPASANAMRALQTNLLLRF